MKTPSSQPPPMSFDQATDAEGLPSANVGEPAGNLERILVRRHKLELALYQRLSGICRSRLTSPGAMPDCRSCRDMVNHAFLDHDQADDEAVETAYYHLANRDGCDGARELRCAEAEHLLSRYDMPEAPGAAAQDLAAA